MDFSVTDEQEIIRKTVIEFARRELNDGVRERDRQQQFSRELCMKCAQLGLLGLPAPEEYGGSGYDPLSTAMALEALGNGCEDGGLVFSVAVHVVSCVVPIWRHGSEAQKRRYLPDLCRGALVGAHAMTEPNSGSDAYAMATRATVDGDGFRLNGTKTLVSNAPEADVFTIFAKTDPAQGSLGGITAFLVGRDAKGLEVGPKIEKLGLRTAPIGELVCDDLYVSADQVLGGVGSGSALFNEVMNWERTCLFAAHVGTMKRLLDRAVSYARTRHQFGQPIGKFQAVSHRLADVNVSIEAAQLLVYKAAWQLGRSQRVSLSSAIAKLFVSEALLKAALSTLQVFGGYGYTTEFGVERALRDAAGSTLYSGTSEIQRNIIAGWLGL